MLTVHEALLLGTSNSPPDMARWLACEVAAVRPRAGQLLFHAGDPSDAIYVLMDGHARASVGEAPRSSTTLLARGCTLFGDRDVLAGGAARETVQMVSSGLLLTWSSEDFVRQWNDTPALREWLHTDQLARYAASLQWADIETRPLTERLAAVLLTLDRGPSELPQPGLLAPLLGATERSVARAVAELRASLAMGAPGTQARLDRTVLTRILGHEAPRLHQLQRSSPGVHEATRIQALDERAACNDALELGDLHAL